MIRMEVESERQRLSMQRDRAHRIGAYYMDMHRERRMKSSIAGTQDCAHAVIRVIVRKESEFSQFTLNSLSSVW